MRCITSLVLTLSLLFLVFITCTEEPAGPDISEDLKPHGSITGYIYCIMEGMPIKDVLVSVNADSAQAGVSDATGKFTVGQVMAGTYTLRFTHHRYENDSTYTITITTGVDDTLEDTVRLSLASYILKGKVVYNSTPLPGAGVAVSGTPYSTLTDENGSFVITNISRRSSRIKLICAKTGFGYGIDSSITCIPDDTTDVGNILLTREGATVYGTVYDTSNNPIKEVYVVAAVGGGLTDTTDAYGSFILENIPCNEKVRIYIPPTDEFYGSAIGFLLKEGSEAHIDIFLRPVSDTTGIGKVSLYADDMIVSESDVSANLIVFPETGKNTAIDTYYWQIGSSSLNKHYATETSECPIPVDTLKKYAGFKVRGVINTAVEVFATTLHGDTSSSRRFRVMIYTTQPTVTAGASLHKDSTAKDAVTVEKNRGVWFKAVVNDPFGGIDSITWDFGDGYSKVFTDTFPNFAFFYDSVDTFRAVVRALDTDGNTGFDTVVVRVIEPLITAPLQKSPTDGDTVFINPGDSIPLTWYKKLEPGLTYTVYMEYKSNYPTEILESVLQDTALKVPVVIGRTYYWRVEAFTGASDASSAVWCFSVAQKVIGNKAPVFDTSSTMTDTVRAGKVYTDTLYAIDADNDPLGFDLLNAPSGMILNNTVITWQTDTVDTGNHPVTARVRDGKGGADTLTWSITVKPPIVVSAPVITQDPQPQTISVGQTATFGVAATGTRPFTFQWQKAMPDTAGDTTFVSINGANDSTYTTPVTTMADNGTLYRCVVSNSVGFVRSGPALLTVNAIAPAITGNPLPQSINPGQTACFGVVATGTKPFAYQWERGTVDSSGDTSYLSINGAMDSSYTTPVTSLADNGKLYRCTVSNSAGFVVSSAALLTVQTGVIAPTIIGEPQPQSVTVGQTAIFGVIATGTRPFTYQWQKDSVTIGGATDSSYTTPATTMGDNGSEYRCIVTNGGGSATSAEALLTVNAIPPTITGDPQPQSVTVGQTATFGVIATGTKPFTYQWQKDSVAIGGATDSSYTTPATTMGDNGSKYRCIVTNSGGSATSAEATLTVNASPPTITGDPQAQTVTVGQTATFGVIASGTKPFTYQWQKDSVIIGGATDSSYTTDSTTIGDNGSKYRCIVTNGGGSATSADAILTVNAIPPTITGDPQPQSVNVGQTATFGVIATGTRPFTYQWQKDTVNIGGATDSSYTTPVTTAGDSGSTYRCIVTNAGGSATSASALLHVSIAVIAPTITGDPQAQTVTVGQTATFGVIASGTKPFTYQWQKNYLDISGATDSSYTIPAASMSDSSSLFRCIVTNGGGSVTSSVAILIVNAIPPTITGDPQPQSVTVGQAAIFGVIATGTKPFTYQWQKDSVNIGGATDSSYTTPVTTMGDNGSKYRCIVTNSGGSATSGVAILTVNPFITDSTKGMTFIPAKDSSFQMGQVGVADTVHTVNFTYNFWIDTTEITQGDYDPLMTTTYSGYSSPSWGGNSLGANYPAYYVNWFDAALYCNARSKLNGRDTVYSYSSITGIPGDDCLLNGLTIDLNKNGYSLPTEAEWEYACRAGTTTEYYWGNDTIVDYAWYSANSSYSAHLVATKLPNGFNLFDMSGNVWEWCNDWHENTYTGDSISDPIGPGTGTNRVSRGGSFAPSNNEPILRTAFRIPLDPNDANPAYGFRVVFREQ